MKQNNVERISVLFSFLGYAIFGFSFLFSKYAMEVSTPIVLLAVRFAVAFIILNLLVLARIFKLNLKGKKIGTLLLLGLLQPILYFLLEHNGIKLLSTSFVGTILALVPVTSLVLSSLIIKEKVSAIQVVFAILSVFGVFLTTRDQLSGTFDLTGFFMILCAVLAASLFNVMSRKISADFTPFERTYVMFALGSATFVGLALLVSKGKMSELILVPLLSLQFWIAVIFLAGLSSVGAFMMLNYAMTHIDVARSSIFANITTVISILAGVLLLKEDFGFYQMIGSTIILISVYAVNKKGKNHILEQPVAEINKI
ncbi:DMT family transporter [Alkalibacter mobilis]|uniref:DMT family transporter n=1 Tax=Alkalibacter mobilis TaxID=2787712 RepID=UPI00189CF8A7|nr:DMT family transporter [Alkalibacter mobilis]MBF7097533.1 DMT family transporter [Alkalibacter mobilis]